MMKFGSDFKKNGPGSAAYECIKSRKEGRLDLDHARE